MKVFISGQKWLGEQVLRHCLQRGHQVLGVCCPPDDRYIGTLARTFGLRIVPAGTLRAELVPEGLELGICAHSFDFVGRASRYRASTGWIGYHPSLLPRHRGRSAVEWTLRMRDTVAGGTVYWLNDGVDRGDIQSQDWCHVDPKLYAMPPKDAAALLWRDQLQPLGVRLLCQAVDDIAAGTIRRVPQDERYATTEPGITAAKVFRPDLLGLPAPQ